MLLLLLLCIAAARLCCIACSVFSIFSEEDYIYSVISFPNTYLSHAQGRINPHVDREQELFWGRKRGGVLGEGQRASPDQLGVLGSAISSPAGFGPTLLKYPPDYTAYFFEPPCSYVKSGLTSSGNHDTSSL